MRLIDYDAVMAELEKEYQLQDHEKTAHEMLNVVKYFPTIEPEQPEIIRCKDCKHSEHWYRDKRRCFLWNEDGIDVWNDGFCNYAERK